jgi:3-hydroxyacyl-[acyl-carrier-protein] dehydratase
MDAWDIDRIQEILPHRYPFLFIDKVTAIDTAARKVVCRKLFTINDYFFAGHFPGNPVVPGVILTEAMAQSSIILFAALKPEIAARKPIYYLGKAEVKFKQAVFPGDAVDFEIEAVKILNSTGIVEAKARVGETVVAEASIGFGIKPRS